MSLDLLNERKKKILEIVIDHYIETAKPVGSEIICKSYNLGVSSATVRNILADLEKEGFLTHPHPSAGRLPTDKGYRFYVDSLGKKDHLDLEEEKQLFNNYELLNFELEEVFGEVSRMLSSVSHYTGFVLAIQPEKSIFKHLKLIHLGKKKILTVFITQSGLIKHRLLKLNFSISAKNLKKMCDILNAKMVGFTITKVKEYLLGKIKEEGLVYDEFLKLAEELNKQIFAVKEEIYLEGISNIVDFTGYAKMKSIFKLVEEKKMFYNIFEKIFNQEQEEKVKVIIGKENQYPEMSNCSLISSIYKINNYPLGLLGVIGPTRMEYARIITVVDYVSKMVNRLLGNLEEKGE